MGILIIKIRQLWDQLIFIMGVPMLIRWNLYIIETVSWFIVGPVSILSMHVIYVIRWHISAVVWPVQNCDLIAWLEEITAKRICTRFQFPRMYLPMDLLSEYRIQHGAIGPLYVTSSCSAWILCRGVSGFETDCPCGVWCRGLTTCLLYVDALFENRLLNNCWAVGLT